MYTSEFSARDYLHNCGFSATGLDCAEINAFVNRAIAKIEDEYVARVAEPDEDLDPRGHDLWLTDLLQDAAISFDAIWEGIDLDAHFHPSDALSEALGISESDADLVVQSLRETGLDLTPEDLDRIISATDAADAEGDADAIMAVALAALRS